MADNTLRSLNASFSRYLRPESGRLRKNGNSRWLFDQLHVKNLVFNIQSYLFVIGLIGLFLPIIPEQYESIRIPGFDGLNFLSIHDVDYKPNESLSKSLLSTLSYLYFLSSLSGFYGIQHCEKIMPNLLRLKNSAIYLLPSALSLLTISFPLILSTLRTIKSIIDETNTQFSIITILDCIRFSLVPIFIFWTLYFYTLYGYFLGYSYHYRRCALRSQNIFKNLTPKGNKVQVLQQNTVSPSPRNKKEAQHENLRPAPYYSSSPVPKSNVSMNHSRYLETVNEESD
ncbi:unnamed protein product [Caenorhabditis angaria]|uniref:Uncharacterized protein n=1 Tax=Caenorhabditis angaria TaxID=860376 RepID=A0A9P1MUN1_9PELO|nr:unnamed protein product [Caenorhabditis angaria]